MKPFERLEEAFVHADSIFNREIRFEEIVSAKTPEQCNERSLGRVFQHYQRAISSNPKLHKSFAIVTAWKGHTDPEGHKQDQTNQEKLHQQLRSWGYGHIRQKGSWVDTASGKTYSEPSLFVPGMSKEHAVHVMNQYSQDAVAFAGTETGHHVHLLSRDGGNRNLGVFHPGRIAQAYSQVKKGHSYVFEAQPMTYVEAMVRQRVLLESPRPKVGVWVVEEDEAA